MAGQLGAKMRNLLLGFLVMMAASAGEAADRPALVEAKTAADKAFKKLSEEYIDAAMKLSPVSGSYVGYRKYDGEWPDYSEAGVKKGIAMLEKYEKEFAKVDRRALSKPFAMDLDIIGDDIAGSLFNRRDLKAQAWDPEHYNEAIRGRL